jgi:hypothetical protein
VVRLLYFALFDEEVSTTEMCNGRRHLLSLGQFLQALDIVNLEGVHSRLVLELHQVFQLFIMPLDKISILKAMYNFKMLYLRRVLSNDGERLLVVIIQELA